MSLMVLFIILLFCGIAVLKEGSGFLKLIGILLLVIGAYGLVTAIA